MSDTWFVSQYNRDAKKWEQINSSGMSRGQARAMAERLKQANPKTRYRYRDLVTWELHTL